MITEAEHATAAQPQLSAILEHAIRLEPSARAVIVADGRSGLARILAQAYRASLPGARFVDFDAVPPREISESLFALDPGDLVVLIQSESFRLGAFRIRVELFRRGLGVIEHPHLARIKGDEHATYLAALAYDPSYYRGVGAALKQRIDSASSAVVHSGVPLFFDSPFEPAKLNVGDYAALPNVGGQFPIGEVFTEARALAGVYGEVRIHAFGDRSFSVNVPPQPITLTIEGGKVISARDSTPEFDAVLAQIRKDEEPWVRELGFGMNRALTRERRVSDVGTYERMLGIHLSLGAKHGVYDKPQLRRKDTRHHVDVFVVTESVTLDGVPVFADGQWTVA